MINPFIENIERETIHNENFRKVLYTSKFGQLVVMSLLPNEEIGLEVHKVDQFFRIEYGEGKVIIDGKEKYVEEGDAIVVPAGCNHNIINVSDSKNMKLYTIYMPPQHKDGTVHATKAEAEADEADHL